MLFGIRSVLVAVIASIVLADALAAAAPKEVPDFAMLDTRGHYYQLRRNDAKVVVLFFTANGCPVVRKSISGLRKLQEDFAEQGVRVWLVNSNTADDRNSIRKEAQEFNYSFIPALLDETQGVAAMLGVQRTATAVCIETTDYTVIYQGAIDDRLVEGAQKAEASEHYLRDALSQHLAGKPVEKSRTVARGCLITFNKEPISYAKQVVPILEQKCFGCHSTGNIGPIKFANYDKVHGVSDMIQEVVLARRMPPWHADRHYGAFSNDSSLTLEESRTLLRWIEQGASRGEGEDPLAAAVPPSSDWALGKPDVIVSLPSVQKIPATGVLDYRHIKVKAPFEEDAWIKGVIAKPGNSRVVHHIIVRVREPGQKGDNPDDAFLIGWAPGAPEIYFPEGTGKFIKKGSVLDFEMHYTTSGREEEDQSSIGLYLHQEKPPMQLKTHAAYSLDFEIPPGVSAHTTMAKYVFEKDSYLFEMSPHMHLRGVSFKFEALYPNGKRETLLSVPRYDFKWQHTYCLKEPKRMPKGTWIVCTGAFDNSTLNPDNPNPKIPVYWGDQSFNEMFIGFMGVAAIPKEDQPIAAR
ncbi:MAG: redoxin domain-containing protein [Limisphaerales bacterium]